MASNSIDPAHTAMLSMDLQSGIVSIYTRDDGLARRADGLLQRGRAAGLTIIHIKVGFRTGLPEIHRRNMLLGAIKESPAHQQLFAGPAGSIHPLIGIHDADLVVTKSRISAFVGTDLGLLLGAREIDTLVMFGIATSGVVLSTALAAADSDYRIFIVKDCCADLDETVHACLIEKMFPRYATVLSSDDVCALLGTAA